MNQAETRAELSVPALKAMGWGAVEGSRGRRESRRYLPDGLAKYHDLPADAVVDLGKSEQIGEVLDGFRKYPCGPPPAA
ncbi:MAG: hypothetical protein KIT13_01715 [Burkholderiales bacterium]|nr:hypothetical protein [Burkholderiales bacterium]MCW5603075.1 hypothetical protein [Burkholderiales bacterium]